MPSRVIVLGSGVGGMSAAHELIERGFEVVILERLNIAGGKARSMPVEDDGPGREGRQLVDTGIASITDKIPGEHGFRFFRADRGRSPGSNHPHRHHPIWPADV